MATWGNTLIGQDDYVDSAYNRARGQYDAGKAAAIRQAGRMGINPNSGAFMNMLNNAQYEATAGANAAANAADAQWLAAAQDQFNRDRAAEMDQQRIDNQSNQWWAQFGAARNSEKAAYEFQRARDQKAYDLANREMDLYYGQNRQNGPSFAGATAGRQVGRYGQSVNPYSGSLRSMSSRYNPNRPFDWTGYTYNPKNFTTWR